MNKDLMIQTYTGHDFERIKAPKSMDAALMIPMIEDAEGNVSILFEIRSSKIIQGGEVCLPGGRVEPGENPEETAVREAEEELCLTPGQARIIAPMFTSNGVGDAFIYTYLGEIKDYAGTFSADEVGSVFQISLDELLAMKPKVNSAAYVIDLPDDFHFELIPGGRNYKWRNRKKDYYFYETPYGVIWGMTGEILYHFIEHVRKSTALKDRDNG